MSEYDEENNHAVPNNPASILRNPMLSKNLAVDVALGTSGDSICEAYDLQYYQLQRILEDEQFAVELAAVRKSLADSDESFKLKCKMQAEHLIDTSWRMIHDPLTEPKVKADLIKSTVRWAGHEAKPGAGGDGSGGFSINIDLSNAGERRGLTIDGQHSEQETTE